MKGFATIKFAKYNPKGSTHGKLKQGLKTGKCFVLGDDNIREIRGNFFNRKLKVIRFLCNCKTSTGLLLEVKNLIPNSIK